MPHKLGLSDREAQTFLQMHYDPTSMDVHKFAQGGNSDVYAFLHHPEGVEQQACVLRIGLMRDGYHKEAMAAVLCRGVPVPRVLQFGEFDTDTAHAHYAVSELIEGELLGETLEADMVPQYLRILDVIHGTDVSATTGFGKIDAEGRGGWESWEAFILSRGDRDWSDV
jgi:hygromycin-B 4-O-kinase